MNEPSEDPNSSAVKVDDKEQKLLQPSESEGKLNGISSNEVNSAVPQAELDIESQKKILVSESEVNPVAEPIHQLDTPKDKDTLAAQSPNFITNNNTNSNNNINNFHNTSSIFMSQSWTSQLSMTSNNVNTLVMDSCLNSCMTHPEEPISYIDISLDFQGSNRFLCIECFSLLPESNRASVVSLRKFLISQESDPNFALFGAEAKEDFAQQLQLSEPQGESNEETQQKKLTEFKTHALNRFKEQLEKVTADAETKLSLIEEKKTTLGQLFQELSDSKILLKIFEESRHDTKELSRLVDEYIKNCHLKVQNLRDGLSELQILRSSFSLVPAEEAVHKILDLAAQLSFFESNSKNVNEQSIVEGGSSILLLNDTSNNKLFVNSNDAVIQLLKTIPNISSHLLEKLEQRVRENNIFEGIDFKVSEDKRENEINDESQAEIKQVCEAITESTGPIENKGERWRAEDVEETLSQSLLSEFIKQALDDKVTLSDIRRAFALKQHFSNISLQSPQFPLANEFTLGDISPLPSKNALQPQPQQQKHSQFPSEILLMQDEVSFGKEQQKEKVTQDSSEKAFYIYPNTNSVEQKAELIGEKLHLTMKKSKLGSNGDITIQTAQNGVITIQNPCDTFMHYIVSKECLEGNKSYSILFQLTCSRSDQILIGIIPKQHIKDQPLHNLPFYKSFVSSSQQTHRDSCERIEKGNSIKIFSNEKTSIEEINNQAPFLESESAQTLQVLMHISLHTRQLTFSDYPQGLHHNSIRSPEDLAGIESFYLSIALSKPQESSLQQPLCVEILDARVSQLSNVYRKTC